MIGAVGTIFIATPLLASLLEREPEYARRKALEEQETAAEALRESEAGIAAEPAPDTPIDTIEHGIAALAHGEVGGDAETGENGETNGESNGHDDEVDDSQSADDAKRERRRQRRKTRPHGRAR